RGEGPVHEHGDPALAGERKDTTLGLALAERVIDLDDVQRLAPEHTLELVVRARRVVTDAEVPNALRRLPLSERAQMCPPVDQVVDLHEIDATGTQAPERLLHLGEARVAPASPDLGREEERV